MPTNQLRPAIVVTAVLMVLTGLVYPGLVTAVAQVFLAGQANGSLVTVNGHVVGSALIGQSFAGARYFHSRPSAAGAGYDDTLSGGSNLGPTSAKLAAAIARAVDSAVQRDGAVKGRVPSDLVTRSGSGLDPDISPASGALQVARVARERGLDTAVVGRLLALHTEPRQFGVLGERRVNVLLLNLALDSLAVPPRAPLTGASAPK